jgi:hypothetical protein
VKKFQNEQEEFVKLCSNCAWRENCTKKFSMDNTKPVKCPDYSPDYLLLKKFKKASEKMEEKS